MPNWTVQSFHTPRSTVIPKKQQHFETLAEAIDTFNLWHSQGLLNLVLKNFTQPHRREIPRDED